MRISKSKNVLLVVCILVMASCSTPKNIVYFQDVNSGNRELDLVAREAIKIMPEDKLSIIVNSQNIKISALFNPNQDVAEHGYVVDSNGNIDFPVLGTLHIAGMTREQVAAYIKHELVSLDYVKNPIVTVTCMTPAAISVMGEVKSPGRYNIEKENVTILDALSQAGDLTIYGKRENVLVMRNENGKQHVYAVNLCSGSDVFASPAYYLKQGDVVYVEPNGTRARQSTVNGNNVRSTAFWISLASLLTSILVLIVK